MRRIPTLSHHVVQNNDQGKTNGPKAPAPSPPMTLRNMRQLGVRNLVASCLNDACRHSALIDVSSYPAETEVPSFRPINESDRSGASNKHHIAA
jgi:hypothetical protein